MIRVFQPYPLQVNSEVSLTEEAMHHVGRVLRARVGDTLHLFNGEGNEYAGVISHIDKKNIRVQINQCIERDPESPLNLILVQGISRGEKMDYTIQKAVELGVKKIVPLITERCNVKLDEERREKRLQHWRSIAISASEQSGRTFIPEITSPYRFENFIEESFAKHNFVLAPTASQKLQTFKIPKMASVLLLIGPEGGLSEKEINQAIEKQFVPLNLGPRILRTETAAVAALTALQFYAGDLS